MDRRKFIQSVAAVAAVPAVVKGETKKPVGTGFGLAPVKQEGTSKPYDRGLPVQVELRGLRDGSLVRTVNRDAEEFTEWCFQSAAGGSTQIVTAFPGDRVMIAINHPSHKNVLIDCYEIHGWPSHAEVLEVVQQPDLVYDGGWSLSHDQDIQPYHNLWPAPRS